MEVVKNTEISSEESSNTDSCTPTTHTNPVLTEMCIFIINDAIYDLQIVENICELPEIDTNFSYKTLDEKIGSVAKSEGPIHLKRKYEDVAEDEIKVKLQQDRSFLEYSLKQLVDELLESETTTRFETLLDDYEKSHSEEEQLLRENEIAAEKVKQLETELQHANIQSVLMCNKRDEIIGRLKDEYEDLLHEFSMKEDYIEKWEESGHEQLETKLLKQEAALEDTIRDFNNKLEREKRVHKEMVAYTNVVIQDHRDGIKYWSSKYANDLEDMDSKIAARKNSKLTQYLNITAIAVLFKEREKEMMVYEEIKEQRRLKSEEIAKIHAKATKIQAWWRGVMVLRKLGPYKVKKPKAKGKGKSGK